MLHLSTSSFRLVQRKAAQSATIWTIEGVRSSPFNYQKSTNNNTSIDPKQFFKHRVRKRRPNLVSQNEDMKETDRRACNIYTAGCTMLRTNILHDATALPHSRPRMGKVQRQGQGFSRHMADKKQGGHMAECLEAQPKWTQRRTQGGHRPRHGGHGPRHGGQSLETQVKRAQGGRKVDMRQTHGPWRTHGAQSLEALPKQTEGKHQGGPMPDTWRTHQNKVWRCGQSRLKANTRRTQGRHMADTWQTRRPKQTQGKHQGGHGGHVVDKFWRRGQSGLKADTRQTHADTCCQGQPKRTQGKHKGQEADTWRTRGRQALGTGPGHIAASLFFLRENPTVNCLGKKE